MQADSTQDFLGELEEVLELPPKTRGRRANAQTNRLGIRLGLLPQLADQLVKKPAYLGRYQGEEEEVESDLTPECALCGEAHVGLENEAVMILRGQWWNNEEIDTPMFLLHPRTKLRVLQLPGGSWP
jgi:hypothetical protein